MSLKKLFDLKGQVAVITGGAGLLGIQHAEALAEYGACPVLLDHDINKASAEADRISTTYNVDCIPLGADITKKKEIETALETVLKKYSGIDILINNAAIDPKIREQNDGIEFSRFENFTLEQWSSELSVGLTGAFICSQVFGGEMAKREQGVIVNISSDLGVIAPDQRLYKKDHLSDDKQPVKPVTYSVIKHGLHGLTKYLATYWSDKNIRVNTLCPGGVLNDQPENFVARVEKLIPMARMANSDEYKGAIVFLCSSASSYMTGSTIVIDGGRTVW